MFLLCLHTKIARLPTHRKRLCARGQSASFDSGSNEALQENASGCEQLRRSRHKEFEVVVKAGEGGAQSKRNTMNRLLAAARVEFARKGLAGARVNS